MAQSENSRPLILVNKFKSVTTTTVYDTYWRFAAERQSIFFRRFHGESGPLTSDPILMRHKFTNAYRASDRVSQFLIRHVAYSGDQSPKEIFFRVVLFKLFNKIETWQLLEEILGSISYAEYQFDRYDRVLTKALTGGGRIYSAAYIMPTASAFAVDARKHRSHLRLLEKLMTDGVPERITDCQSMNDAFNLLRSYPMFGDFLAYQFITDLNYSRLTNFSEMEFVVPGPGARDGLRKCFKHPKDITDQDLIRFVAERQEMEFERRGIMFQSLWSRPLQLIDCQNLFCEVDKYARVAHPDALGRSGRARIKQLYHPNTSSIKYWYPPKWGLNEAVTAATHVPGVAAEV